MDREQGGWSRLERARRKEKQEKSKLGRTKRIRNTENTKKRAGNLDGKKKGRKTMNVCQPKDGYRKRGKERIQTLGGRSWATTEKKGRWADRRERKDGLSEKNDNEPTSQVED